MTEDRIIELVRRALDALERDESVDLDALCRDHPELRDDVSAALGLRDGLAAVQRAASEIDPRAGRVYGDRYRLMEPLGRGAMGVVYAAWDDELQREVAVKIFESYGADPTGEGRARFVREATLLANISHENVVAVFDRGASADGAELYLVMDRLRGRPLSAILHAGQAAACAAIDREPDFGPWWRELWSDVTPTPRPPRTTWLRTSVAWIADIASGLAAAHERGVVHRDVKPSNIFVRDDQTAVLIDFGIARRRGEQTLTRAGSSLGTPWYMAPEQIEGGTDTAVDPATARDAATVDVYSLCATLYHAATLQPPYGGTAESVFAEMLLRAPRPIATVRPDLPRDLIAIIERGMERRPAQRYPSMRALEADLRAFLDHRPVQARPITAVGRTIRNARRRPARAVATLFALVLLPTIGLTWWLWADAAARERRLECDSAIASLPRLLSVEGRPSERSGFPQAPRDRHLATLDRILALEPDALPYRAHRAALLEDSGAAAAAQRAWRDLADQAPSPLTRAVAAAGGAIAPGALPAPGAGIEHFLVAFLELRQRARGFSRRALEHLDRLEPPIPRPLLAALDLRLVALTFVADVERDREAATRALDEAERLDARRGRVTAATLATRGYVLAARRQSTEAEALLRRSGELCPNQFEICNNLATLARRQLDFAAARDLLVQALALRPQFRAAHQNLATLHAHLGDFETARGIAAKLPIEGPEFEWRRPMLLAEIALLDANFHVDSDVAHSQERAAEAVTQYDLAAPLAPTRYRPVLARRRAFAAAVESRDWATAARELLDDLGQTGQGIDDPYRIHDLATILGRLDVADPLRSPLVVFLHRLASALAPSQDDISKAFRKRQIDAIRAELQRR